MASPPESIGQIIGNYHILSELGRGGMGTVYRARDIRLDREVALKLLPEDSLRDEEALNRFRKEARAASSLNHPHICTVYEAGEANGIPFLSMELLEGRTLAHALASGVLPIHATLRLGEQICDALQYAHERGIIHRDLKPSNIFITSRDDAKLLDFGLAKKIFPEFASATQTTVGVDLTMPGRLLGTVAYMSPEQAEGKPLDARTDLFSFGAVLYEMATGLRAFPGDSSATVLVELLHGQPVPPQTINSKVPPELQSIIAKALEKNPADRYQSAKELMIDLRRLSRQLTAPAHSDAAKKTSAPSGLFRSKLARYALLPILIAAAIALAILLAPQPVTAPLDSTQITFSAEPKEAPLFTDGSRLYFTSRDVPSQMAVSGGVIAPMKILDPGMAVLDISADASKVLALKPALNDEMRRGTLWEAPIFGGIPRKLSDHLAQVARWSPDGRSIAFMDRQSLYICDADGTNERKIWEAPGYSYSLAFSPDGTNLAVSVDFLSTTTRLWILKANGNNPHPLALDWPANASESNGEWTPDGRHFIFLSDLEGRANVYERISPPWYKFWKKPSAVRMTGNQVAIEAFTPARDAKSLFVLGRLEQGAMQALDPQAKRFTPFLNGIAALQFVISPDRQWMAYTEYPTMYLWKSRLDGSDRVQLTSSPAYMEQWSPDGKSIAYMDWKQIYIVSADGGVPQRIPPSDGNQVAPSWAPDGGSIYFNNFPYPGQPIKGIQVLDLATQKISLMPGSAGYYVPSWSPDGKYLVAMAQNPSRMVLYSAETKQWKDLKQFNFEWGYWVWANDSKSIYMAPTLNNIGVYQLTVPDGKWTRVSGLDNVTLRGLAGDSFLSITSDGQPALMSDASVTQIYSLRWK